MDENAYSWLVDFILGCLSDEERARVNEEASRRYAEMVDRDPLSPSTIAERALEHFIFSEE